jgi:carboxypeptidase T
MKWPGAFVAWVWSLILFAPLTAWSQGTAPPDGWNTNLIVRLYYGDRSRLDQLVSQYDIFEFADHTAGYVDARLTPSGYAELTGAGYRVEIYPEQTALANQPAAMAIPNFPCYRTVEETYATLMQITNNYPNLASLADIGDSWEKVTPGGPAGYDLLVLVLSNKSRPGPKPRFLLVAEYHARELVTAETATRFAEELVAGYGVDADITWILDYFEVHIVPMVNPDGRKRAEAGNMWRKNTDNNDGCASSYGTDLNRNCSFKWGLSGSSGDPCAETYRGPSTFSEPEGQAVRDYCRALFPDQRGTNDTDAAAITATGLIVSLHSYGELVLHSWGWTTTAVPNLAGLQMLGGKFSYFNHYTVQPTIDLYAVSGELNDWAYGELGVATYTIEMGTSFFQSCSTFQNGLYPSNRPALYYAAKACRLPYLTPAGPDVLTVTATGSGSSINLSGSVVSGRIFGFTPLPAPANITAARYTVDNPSWINGATNYPMTALDTNFNSPNETVIATINTAGWTPGRHTIFVEGRTGTNTWGLPTAVFVNVIPPPVLTASLQSNQIALHWPSVSNTVYTLLQASNLNAPFSVRASNILAAPPTNTFLDTIGDGLQLYRLKVQP